MRSESMLICRGTTTYHWRFSCFHEASYVLLSFQRWQINQNYRSTAYGNYNDLVREASYIRNQSLVIWDFE